MSLVLNIYDFLVQSAAKLRVIRAYRNTDPSTMDLRQSPESPEDVA